MGRMWHSDTADMPVSGPAALEISLETSLQPELIVSIQFNNYILGIYAREKENIFSHINLHENLLRFIPNGKNKTEAALIPFSRLKVRQTSAVVPWTITEQPRRKIYS